MFLHSLWYTFVESEYDSRCDTTEDCVKLSPYAICDEDFQCSCRGGEQLDVIDDVTYCHQGIAGDICDNNDMCLSKMKHQ